MPDKVFLLLPIIITYYHQLSIVFFHFSSQMVLKLFSKCMFLFSPPIFMSLSMVFSTEMNRKNIIKYAWDIMEYAHVWLCISVSDKIHLFFHQHLNCTMDLIFSSGKMCPSTLYTEYRVSVAFPFLGFDYYYYSYLCPPKPRDTFRTDLLNLQFTFVNFFSGHFFWRWVLWKQQ